MRVIRADILGFCAGVRRAVSAAVKALDEKAAAGEAAAVTLGSASRCAAGEASSGRVYTFGPLIHNPVALAELSARGLRVLDESGIESLCDKDTVLIRAHGVSPLTHSALEARGASVINATCPLVTKSQKRAADFAAKGYTIIFAGDKNHGEVIGIQGYAEEAARSQGREVRFLLVRTAEEAEGLFTGGSALAGLSTEEAAAGVEVTGQGHEQGQPVVLLSQTTFSIKEFERISAVLKNRLPDIEIYSSICPATHERQDALKRLCAQVDGVLVIGGRNSSNTARLFSTAEKLCPKAALIERAEEIPPDFFRLETVGITAGASTPDSVIAAVEERLQQEASVQS